MGVFPVGVNGARYGFIDPDTGEINPETYGIAGSGSFAIRLIPPGSPMIIHSNPAIDGLFASDHFPELFKAGKAYDPQCEVTVKGNFDGEQRWLAIQTMPVLLDNGDWVCIGRLLSDAEIERIEADKAGE